MNQNSNNSNSVQYNNWPQFPYCQCNLCPCCGKPRLQLGLYGLPQGNVQQNVGLQSAIQQACTSVTDTGSNTGNGQQSNR